MRRSNTQIMGDVLKDYIHAMDMNQKLKEVQVINLWEELIGKSIARKTKDIYIKDKTLHVALNSSVVRHELFLIKEEIIKRMNERMGEKIIENIILK